MYLATITNIEVVYVRHISDCHPCHLSLRKVVGSMLRCYKAIFAKQSLLPHLSIDVPNAPYIVSQQEAVHLRVFSEPLSGEKWPLVSADPRRI